MIESAFTWLGQLIEWFGKWIPRLGICRSTHRGVRFRNGKILKEIKPGLYIYWPLVTEVEIKPIARQTVDIPTQVLTTKDEETVAVSTVLVYEIADIVTAVGSVWDVDSTIMELSGNAVVEAVLSRTMDELREELTTKVRSEMTRKTRSILRPYGINVIDTRFDHFAPTIVLRIFGDARYNS